MDMNILLTPKNNIFTAMQSTLASACDLHISHARAQSKLPSWWSVWKTEL
jgi:hypothetical protein